MTQGDKPHVEESPAGKHSLVPRFVQCCWPAREVAKASQRGAEVINSHQWPGLGAPVLNPPTPSTAASHHLSPGSALHLLPPLLGPPSPSSVAAAPALRPPSQHPPRLLPASATASGVHPGTKTRVGRRQPGLGAAFRGRRSECSPHTPAGHPASRSQKPVL